MFYILVILAAGAWVRLFVAIWSWWFIHTTFTALDPERLTDAERRAPSEMLSIVIVCFTGAASLTILAGLFA